MRSTIFLSTFITFWSLTLCAVETSPFSETDFSALSQEKMAVLSSMQQECIAHIKRIKLEREKTLEIMIKETPQFKEFYDKKVIADSCALIGSGAILTAAAQKIASHVNPYLVGMLSNQPKIAEIVDSFSEFLPLAGLGLSAAAGALYAYTKFKNPQLDPTLLATVHQYETARQALFDDEAHRWGLTFDFDMLTQDDFDLINEFQKHLKGDIACLSNTTKLQEAEKAEQKKLLEELRKKHTNRQILIQKKKQESTQADILQQHNSPVPQEPSKKKKHRITSRFPAMLTLTGLAGASTTSSAHVKRTYGLSEAGSHTLATGALMGGVLMLAASSYAHDHLRDAFHETATAILAEKQQKHFAALEAGLTNAVLDRVSLHQEESRLIAQEMDSDAMNVLAVSTALDQVLKGARVTTNTLKELNKADDSTKFEDD